MSVEPANDDERWLASEVAAGRIADFTTRTGANSEPVDIRGDFLRTLALTATRPTGLAVYGVHITGLLDLQLCQLSGPLVLRDCVFAEPLDLSKALLVDVDLSGTQMPGLNAVSADIQHDLTLSMVIMAGGLNLISVSLGGRLDLTGGTFTGPEYAIAADGAQIKGDVFCGAGFHATGEVRLVGTMIGGQLDLTGGTFIHTHGDAISADGAHIKGGVFSETGFQAQGGVRFHSVTIDGPLNFTGGIFTNPNGYAISVDGASINAGMFCRSGFHADGEVRMISATIGGQLDLAGGTFSNPNGYAISADRVNLKGHVFFGPAFHADGEVRLLGATIDGQLGLTGGTFNNPGGRAISADGARMNGGLFCGAGLHSYGEVRLHGTYISGQLDLTGGTFTNPGGKAISADGARIDGGVLCRTGFHSDGEVRLHAANISGQLDLTGGTFTNPNGYAISADRAQVGTLHISNGDSAGRISLVGAHTGYLSDVLGSWEQFSSVSLLNFTYDRIATAGWLAPSRLTWLQQERDYRAQPYEQLAQALRAQGHEREAREVMVAKNRRRRDQQNQYRRISGYVFDWLLGYGYHPWRRTLPALILLYALGVLLFFSARHNHAIIATRASIHQSTTIPGTATGGGATSPSTAAERRPVTATAKCPSDYPCFSPWAFTADALIPLVNTHQTDFWAVSGSTRAGQWALYYSWLASPLGWLLTTAAALGFTGLIRRD